MKEAEANGPYTLFDDAIGHRWIGIRQLNRGWRLRDGEKPDEQTDGVLRRFGPKDATHPTVGNTCLGCQQELKAGDYTTLIALGPGDDVEDRISCLLGRPYNAVAIEVHWACATGDANAEAYAFRRW